MSDPTHLSLSEARDALRAKRLSASELAQAHVDAVAGAPYFAHDGAKPFTVDGARAAIDSAVTAFKGINQLQSDPSNKVTVVVP